MLRLELATLSIRTATAPLEVLAVALISSLTHTTR